MKESEQKPKQLFRSRTNYVIFGVCGGLGDYFGVDPIILRVLLVFLVLWAGSGVLLYLVLAFLIPRSPIETKKTTEASIDFKERAEGLLEEFKALIDKYAKTKE